jgi:hypothetical protein
MKMGVIAIKERDNKKLTSDELFILYFIAKQALLIIN